MIIATGPADRLTRCANAIAAYFGQGGVSELLRRRCAAGDGGEPLIWTKAWFASRYDRGTPDYINCALPEESLLGNLCSALASAEEAPVHGFEDKHGL